MSDFQNSKAVAEIAVHERNRLSEAPLSLSDRVRSLRLPDHSARGGSSRTLWLLGLLCLLLTASTGYFGYLALHPGEVAAASPADVSPTSAGANSAGVASSGEVALESKGYIIPAHQIQVSPKVSGQILKLYIEEGKRVQKGAVLAEFEKIDYQADYDHSLAYYETSKQRYLELKNGNRPEEIAAAKAELEESEAQREQLYLDWKRNINLKSGNALAAKDYELAESSYRAMDRRVERLRKNYKLMVDGPRIERVLAAKADMEQAQADLAKMKWRLDNCTVCAPISGTILTKIAEEGNIVNQLSFNLKGSLCDMADLADLEVDLSRQERDVSRVFRGQQCRVRAEAYPDRIYEGYVSRLMPIGDRAKGAVPVRVKLKVPKEEEGVYLKPEMGAIVSFLKK